MTEQQGQHYELNIHLESRLNQNTAKETMKWFTSQQ